MKGNEKLDSLTSLRFFAAFFIVVYHAKDQFPFLNGFCSQFALEQAVSFFFILSGFILTYAHEDLSVSNCKSYLLSRFLRIYPLHLFSLFLLLILLPQSIEQFKNWQITLAYLTLTHAWIPIQDFYFAWNSPSWSISAEWFFYLSLPLLLAMARKKTGLPLLFTAIFLTLPFLLVDSSCLEKLTQIKKINELGLVYINPLVRITEFALGVCLARLRPQIKTLPTPTLCELFSLALFFITCHFSTKMEAASASADSLNSNFLLWASHSSFSALPAGILIIIFSLGKGLISKYLSFRPLVLLGEISFAIYMLHYVLLCYKFETLPLIYNLSGFLRFTVVLILSSYLAYAFVEKPTRYLGKSSKAPKFPWTKKELSLLFILPIIIYAAMPGPEHFQREFEQGSAITFSPVQFSEQILLKQMSRGDDYIVCRFSSAKNLILFHKAELQLLDKEGKVIGFLQNALSARPQFAGKDSQFDLRMPVQNGKLKEAKHMTVKLINDMHQTLLPENGEKYDRTRALIKL